MRLRSLLLCGCLVVVPLLAMFSHRVPRDVVLLVRERCWQPLARSAGWEPQPKAAPATAVPPVTEAGAEPAGSGPSGTASPADGSPPPTDQRVVEDRLLRLGATSIACQRLAGGGGELVASCRMPVDPAGELQRVFQATGTDSIAALARLLADVEAWKLRSAPPSRRSPQAPHDPG